MARSSVALSPFPDVSRCDQPRMALSGVRSSCDRVARNSSFSRLTASALARALLALEQLQPLGFDPPPLLDLFLQRQVGLVQLARPGAHAVLELLLGVEQSLGLALERLTLLKQLDEDGDLGLQGFRTERLEHVVDGADRVAAEDMRVAAIVGGQEDDRRLPAAFAAADQLRGLVAIHVGHGHVEQDQREIPLQNFLESFAARRRPHEVVGGVGEDRLERQQVLLVIVHDQDVDLRHHVRVPSDSVTRWSPIRSIGST